MIEPDLPELLRDRVRCEGRYRLDPTSEGGTTRRVDGDLSVRAPLLGGAVEERRAAMLEVHVADEAASPRSRASRVLSPPILPFLWAAGRWLVRRVGPRARGHRYRAVT